MAHILLTISQSEFLNLLSPWGEVFEYNGPNEAVAELAVLAELEIEERLTAASNTNND